MKIKTAIIDDDKVFTSLVEHYLDKVDFVDHQQTFNDSTIAYNDLDTSNVDVLFIDMNIPKMNGLELLNSMEKVPSLVFVSSEKDYSVDAFDYEAIDFLHKPVTMSRFLKTMNRIKTRFDRQPEGEQSSDDAIFIRNNGFWIKVKFEDILYIKADNNNVIIATKEKRIKTNLKLKQIVEMLPESTFMQVHRSYLVQLKQIHAVDGEVLVINNRNIPISKTYMGQLYDRLNLRH